VLRNVAEPVEIFAVVRVDETADHLAIDPVCRMAVDPERAVGRLLVDDKAHYFCSLTCAAAFAQHSERYAD
jgi:YHS domain-containing protein